MAYHSRFHGFKLQRNLKEASFKVAPPPSQRFHCWRAPKSVGDGRIYHVSTPSPNLKLENLHSIFERHLESRDGKRIFLEGKTLPVVDGRKDMKFAVAVKRWWSTWLAPLWQSVSAPSPKCGSGTSLHLILRSICERKRLKTQETR